MNNKTRLRVSELPKNGAVGRKFECSYGGKNAFTVYAFYGGDRTMIVSWNISHDKNEYITNMERIFKKIIRGYRIGEENKLNREEIYKGEYDDRRKIRVYYSKRTGDDKEVGWLRWGNERLDEFLKNKNVFDSDVIGITSVFGDIYLDSSKNRMIVKTKRRLSKPIGELVSSTSDTGIEEKYVTKIMDSVFFFRPV